MAGETMQAAEELFGRLGTQTQSLAVSPLAPAVESGPEMETAT